MVVLSTWILCAGLLLPYAISEDVLKFVHIVYRHGDRTPYYIFPNDVNNTESTWYQGLNELIPAGMRRSYQLGKWFRQRYEDFLDETFDLNQIYVRSSAYNRTIMSAMCNLAGLYPPTGDQKWNTNINWQPIPVNTVEKDNDYILRTHHMFCPKFNQLRRKLLKSPKVMQLQRDFGRFMRFLNIKTGYNKTGIEHFSKLYDAISNGYWIRKDRMMPWINESIVQQVIELDSLRVRYFKYEHDTIKRLLGGPILKDIMERMEQKRQKELDHRLKIYFYSGHDANVLALLKAMNIEVHRRAPYAGAVMVELYESNTTGKWTVRTFMKNDTGENDMGTVNPHELQVGGCPPASPCPLDQFIERSHPFIPEDWSAECFKGFKIISFPTPPTGKTKHTTKKSKKKRRSGK